jgi:hypothetical protein
VHFAGPTTRDTLDPDPTHIDPWDAVRERDSDFFEQTSTVGIPQHTLVSPSVIGGVLTAPTSGSLSLKVGTSLGAAIQATVTGDRGVCDGDPNTELKHTIAGTGGLPGIAGIAVELTAAPAAGVNFTPLNTSSGYTNGIVTVAETDTNGVARFDVAATAVGSYTVTLSIRQLVPDGTTQGAVIKTLTLSITVTP